MKNLISVAAVLLLSVACAIQVEPPILQRKIYVAPTFWSTSSTGSRAPTKSLDSLNLSGLEAGHSPLRPLASVHAALTLAQKIADSQQQLLSAAEEIEIVLYAGMHQLEEQLSFNEDGKLSIIKKISGSPCTAVLEQKGICSTSSNEQGSMMVGAKPVKLQLVPSLSTLPVYSTILSKTDFPQETIWQVWRFDNETTSPVRIPMTGTTPEFTRHYTKTDKAFFSVQDPTYTEGLMDILVDPSTKEVRPGVVWRSWHSWTSPINRLSNVTQFSNGTINVIVAGSMGASFDGASGDRFSPLNFPVDNVPASLGGNFFAFNPSTRQIKVQLPMSAQPEQNITILVPYLYQLLSLNHSASGSNKAFENIGFGYTDMDLAACLDYGCDGQSAAGALQEAVVHLHTLQPNQSISNVNFTRVQFRGTGTYAFWANTGSQNVNLVECLFEDLGSGAIRIGRMASSTSGGLTGLVSNVNVMNSTLRSGGHVVQMGVGILLQQARDLEIAFNNINTFRYTGISTGWTWGYAPTYNRNLYVHDNHIHTIGMGQLSDMGCIYNLGISPGTVFDHNICHDVMSYGYGGWGLYDDEGTSNVVWSNNIVYRTKAAAMHHHYGQEDLMVNNIFAFPQQPPPGVDPDTSNGDFAGIRSSDAPPGSGKYSLSSFSAQRNIVIQRNKTATLFYRTWKGAFDNTTFDNNCYWNTELAPSSLAFPTWCQSCTPSSEDTFAEWQKEGQDVNSLVTDPMFISPYNATTGEYNFYDISSESPCVKQLGFKPIPRLPENMGGGW